MTPIDELSSEGRRVVDEFVRLRTRDPRSFCVDISADDAMYRYLLGGSDTLHPDDGVLHYLESAKLMLEELRPVVEAAFGGFDRVDSLLDFACGHGRLTRFLVQEVSPDRITVADIDADAVAFQRSRFGVTGKVSTAVPEDYDDDHRYQLILVCSLFSHLPAATFGGWLRRLYGLLAEDGVIVFSVHDEALMPEGAERAPEGMVFMAQSESRWLDPRQYGTAFVSEAFVGNAIAGSCPGCNGYVRIPKGLWRHQDLYVVARGGARDIDGAGANRGPLGYVDRCVAEPSLTHVTLEGWAFDFDEGATVEQVEVSAGGVILATCRPRHPRPDVAAHYGDTRAGACGWRCRVARDRIGAESVLVVTVVSDSGRSVVIAFDTLERLRRIGG